MSTLFTPVFKKPLLAASAVATGVLLYVCIVFGMISLSTWAERDLDAFPFKEEDWLRYLLPSRFTDTDKQRIMLAGPSTVRENLLYRQFEKAFPQYSVYPGGISLGTIDDVTASLEYIEKVYGENALPDVLVLGVSPRVIGNIPEQRPFSLGLDRYSPYYAARHTDSGIELVPKGLLDSLHARLNFLSQKQPGRFRTALLAILTYWLADGKAVDLDPHADRSQRTMQQQLFEKLFKHPLAVRVIRNGRFRRALDFEFSQVLAWFISPSKYLLSERPRVEGLKDWLTDPDSWWATVYSWNPLETQAETSATIKRLTGFIRMHDIRLMVINLPERDISRELFDDAYYQAYLDLVRESFGDVPFLNYREFSSSDEFYDVEHTVYRGSLRLSKDIIRQLKEWLANPGKTQEIMEVPGK